MSNKLLLVEDNNGVREVLSLLFAAHGYSVTECEDGKTAVTAAMNQCFDIAIIDVGLPDISGYKVASQIRKLAPMNRSDTILVALTARSNQPTRRDALAAGFDIHFAKPAQVSAICEEIENTRSRRAALVPERKKVA